MCKRVNPPNWEWDDYQFQVGLNARDFSPQALPKAAR